MAGPFGPDKYPDLMEDIQSTLETIARLQRERTTLHGRASVRRGRVTAVVNADSVLVDLKFGRGVEDLEYPELARAVIEAVQQACADVAQKSKQLMAPLDEQRSRLPKLSDLVPGMPDVRDRLPQPEPAPVTKPATQEIYGEEGDQPDREMTFDNVEMVDKRKTREPGVTDSGW
ncbi:YbaB/EbfC family nucleoid-associated protein [Nocardia sp. CDC159]|uniref:YbaB/EbfC family nucleoid-associated protein n=1 Tax=Nocardia pulmonis TaxID=2951408 RepID=A0A9X2E872_9NOCA|nr:MULTISPECIES: YbaB/EbfC family nucleoid-associated protein [Nocardia]MCM6776084.1 YbaB/EbfC family nucleoid-associated protein [Nocardia pulmonis]MCM6788589.1 YbaB/EbfC family nucleoid-associated protein [Nocardia sp. CDC159]